MMKIALALIMVIVANVAMAATAANQLGAVDPLIGTRQIPVAEIAALTDNATTNVTVTDCEPGFYYMLHDGAVLTDVVR